MSKVIEPLRTDFDKENVEKLISEIHSFDKHIDNDRSRQRVNYWVGFGLDAVSVVLAAASVPLFAVPVFSVIAAGGVAAAQVAKDRWFPNNQNEKKNIGEIRSQN